ncbi:flagellar biosynthetic protein FliO [Leifsonia shinshuensis]|uniref:flagellar biosynthetic protein FliO n=1 Tax=Leifsonia shinshuensis TaxID=150026 RepID=UPI001F50E8EA|nr:flagellar biosynthetic protein FliO [Leifsonia shinshuensis]MCI0156943.1 flagellar biosynthetic protein FliO [Leifsonia shinshuensis]
METLFVALRVLVVLGVIVGLLWFVQRRITRGRGARGGRTRRGNAVSVVGRQGVGPKASVVVVDVDGNRFVLGVTERQVSVLHTGARPQDVDAEVTPLVPVRKTFAKDIDAAGAAVAASGTAAPSASVGAQGSTDTRQDADFLTAQGRASLFDEALKGSILSPATWRQASSAVRQKR